MMSILFAFIFIAVGAAGYWLLKNRIRKRKYSVATVKKWWEEEYKDSGIDRTKTLYEIEFRDTDGIAHKGTLTRWSDNDDGAIANDDELDILYKRPLKREFPRDMEPVEDPSKGVFIYLALFFFGLYLLGFPLFNYVLVWLLPTTY